MCLFLHCAAVPVSMMLETSVGDLTCSTACHNHATITLPTCCCCITVQSTPSGCYTTIISTACSCHTIFTISSTVGSCGAAGGTSTACMSQTTCSASPWAIGALTWLDLLQGCHQITGRPPELLCHSCQTCGRPLELFSCRHRPPGQLPKLWDATVRTAVGFFSFLGTVLTPLLDVRSDFETVGIRGSVC